MKIRAVSRSFYPVCLLGAFLAALLAQPIVTSAQEKKNVRMVFVSLAWNSEIPFRTALARGFFKQQGLQVEPILIRGGFLSVAVRRRSPLWFPVKWILRPSAALRQFFAVKRAVWIWLSLDALRARPIIFFSVTSRRVAWRI
jgi:hypothetical protein